MKKLIRKRTNKNAQTIEAFICVCVCVGRDCNPCGSVPSHAYIAQRDLYLTNARNNISVSKNLA